jgi:peptidyl-prolyl cis-trans isomerase D
MFETVHKHRRLAQIVLALLIIPFAFFGVDSYFRRDAVIAPVATVGGTEVSRAEFDDLVRQQQERMRAAMGRGFDPAIFDNPEVRFALVEQLVSQRLLQKQARGERFRVTDSELARVIGEIEPFRVDGKFSPERYRQLLAQQNMTPAMFEQRMRDELLLAPLQEPLATANIVARSSGERFAALLEQQREVAFAVIDAEPFAKGVKIDDAAVKAFYDQNQAAFQTPEQARIEYVLLTLPALAAQVSVDPAEIRKQYDANLANYTKAEERSAAHILVALKPGAKDDDKAAAKKKAETLLQQARAAGANSAAKFAELAKANSEDPGSAGQGGDLGAFARGSMVKPFEDAVFAAKVGDIVGPVETEFGYHVIRVTKAEPGRTRSFDEVRNELEQQVRQSKAQARFAQAADQLQNLVYEQADSLAPVQKALDVKVNATPFVSRAQVQQLALGNAKFVQALFAPESIQGKRNTEAIEVAPNALMAGRIVEYKPAAPRPFDEVKDEIRRQLTARGASELAQKAGQEKLAQLEQGRSEKEAGVAFGKPVSLQRGQPQPGFTPDAVTRVFQADPAKLPKFIGAANERGGFSIYKLIAVTTPPLGDPKRLEAANARLGDQLGRELVNAYVATLKSRAEVKINQQALEKK